MTTINGSTKFVGIFGYPVKHTLSPAMHNAAFEALELNYLYLPFEVSPENLGAAMKSLHLFGLRGVNITVPHKEAAVKFVDRIDPIASKIGAINTVVAHNGKLSGYNTDGPGFIRSLEGRFDVAGKKVLLAGAGGAGKAIGITLGHSGINKIFVYDTDINRSGRLFQCVKPACRAQLVRSASELGRIMPEIDLLVNATPVGMHKGDCSPVAPELISRKLFVYDIVYNRETILIKEARKKGCKFLSGLDMLLYQGVLAFHLWTHKNAPVEAMRRALLAAMK
ncbi:MAG: shikimate dehydrogenase [Elusimicrobia bacterium RIFOXYB2_FULL_48_7]|nr:MAG: shikimate dehydrogenase [Elusimicrobia bacterium RIFOXYB2_FULL_48_7]